MKIHVLVVDVSQSERPDLLAAQRAFPRFAFQPLANKTDEHCPRNDPSAHLGRPGNISCPVRQQTRDVAAALRQCAAAANHTGWLLLVEDDTPLCQGGLPEVLFVLAVLQRLAAAPLRCPWRLADFSRTFSGTAVPAALAGALADGLAARASTLPVDHAVWRDWAPGRAHQYAGNLLRHRGRVSAFPHRNADAFRREHDAFRFADDKTRCAFDPGSAAGPTHACAPPPIHSPRRRAPGPPRVAKRWQWRPPAAAAGP
jgi:hypothetical protein